MNFMVPDDSIVQNLLQMYMEKERIDLEGTTSSESLNRRLIRLEQELFKSGLQDVDIMEQFCRPPLGSQSMPLQSCAATGPVAEECQIRKGGAVGESGNEEDVG